MIKKKSGLLSHAIVVTVISFLGMSQGAIAAPCTAEVDALKTALNDGVCQNSRVCQGLSHKLDSANRKLEKGRYRRAARNLADFGSVIAHMEKQAEKQGESRSQRKSRHHRSDRFQRGHDLEMSKYQQMMGTYFNAAVACVSNPDAYGSDDSDGVIPVNDQPVEEVYDPQEEVY